jgi:sugar phosphate isomerase/epimerase
MTTASPRLFLAVDNCFASKRWTAPAEWMALVRDVGLRFVEASADNECDPLYAPADVLRDWAQAVRDASQHTGVRVINLYSGHGTYATLGLAHPDVRVREHIHHRWLEPMIELAASVEAGLGFFCHAFDQSTLADPARYAVAEADLFARLHALAQHARQRGLPAISCEQMYSPHQIPWTLAGAAHLLRQCHDRDSALYLTLDVGHAGGQRNFLRDDLPHAPDYATAAPEDADPYAWIERIAPYAPIVHLQQTDGASSAHRPFTARHNASGIITPRRVLEAMARAFAAPADPAMPPRVTEIALTLEIFTPTAERPQDTLRHMAESAALWRRALPEDGMTLAEALAALPD